MLSSQYAGLSGNAYNCTVASTATTTGQPYAISATVQQGIQFASIPVFQFAVFYNLDLDIEPGAPMTINGKVFSNQNIWMWPGGTL